MEVRIGEQFVFFFSLYLNPLNPIAYISLLFSTIFGYLMSLYSVNLVTDLDFRVLHSLNIPLSVETVCVFTAPVFSAFAAWATYLLTKVCILSNS